MVDNFSNDLGLGDEGKDSKFAPAITKKGVGLVSPNEPQEEDKPTMSPARKQALRRRWADLIKRVLGPRLLCSRKQFQTLTLSLERLLDQSIKPRSLPSSVKREPRLMSLGLQRNNRPRRTCGGPGKGL